MKETKPVKTEKVLYVFGGEKASGAEIVIERLINYNLDSVEPHLFIAPGDFASQLISHKRPYQIVVHPCLKKLNRSSGHSLSFYMNAFRNYFLISNKVLRYCRKNKINIIHANTIVPASYLIPAIIYSRIFRPKKKWLWSDHDLKYFSKLDHIFSSLCVRLYNKTLTVSEAVKAKYESMESAEVLYNGLDIKIFKPDIAARELFRKANNISDKDIVLAIAATISPRKGQLQLVEAFKNIQTSFPDVHLLIAGGLSGDSPQYVQLVLNEMKKISKVNYIGHVKEMIHFYNGCDIIINNSSGEGSEPLGTSIYEAMACEKIVVASKTGGTPEIIEDGIDGFLFEADDVAGLEQTMAKSISQFPRLCTVKNKAREKVIRKFNIDKMVARYNEIIGLI